MTDPESEATQAAAGDVVVEGKPPIASVNDEAVTERAPLPDPPADDGPVDHAHAAQRDLRAAASALVEQLAPHVEAELLQPTQQALAGVGDSAASDLHKAVDQLMRRNHPAVAEHAAGDTLMALRRAFEYFTDVTAKPDAPTQE